VRNIVNKKIVDKRIYLSIYVVEVDKIILNTCLYVIKDIKTNIVLENNMLE